MSSNLSRSADQVKPSRRETGLSGISVAVLRLRARGARFQFVGTDPALKAAGKAYYEYRAARRHGPRRSPRRSARPPACPQRRPRQRRSPLRAPKSRPLGTRQIAPLPTATLSAVASDGTSSLLEMLPESRRLRFPSPTKLDSSSFHDYTYVMSNQASVGAVTTTVSALSDDRCWSEPRNFPASNTCARFISAAWGSSWGGWCGKGSTATIRPGRRAGGTPRRPKAPSKLRRRRRRRHRRAALPRQRSRRAARTAPLLRRRRHRLRRRRSRERKPLTARTLRQRSRRPTQLRRRRRGASAGRLRRARSRLRRRGPGLRQRSRAA